MYSYPPMPLDVAVWWSASSLPPAGPPDEVVKASISPVRPEDHFRANRITTDSPGTHIIRTAANPHLGDNLVSDGIVPGQPFTLFEYPINSGHFYMAVWAHQVGTGFENWHARVYALRVSSATPPDRPLYVGWV